MPLIVVSRQLGHANPNITAEVYVHLLGDWQLDAAAAAFGVPETARMLRDELRERAEDPGTRMDSGIPPERRAAF